jgi:tetratricopeptide (TPR) repeat protein
VNSPASPTGRRRKPRARIAGNVSLAAARIVAVARLCQNSLSTRQLQMRKQKSTPPTGEFRQPATDASATRQESQPLPVPAPTRFFWLCAAASVLAILAAYANHFHNSFHFDDAHAVVDNVYIRDLHNIPRFFTDATTFSSLPANQTWRPIVSTSLAIDYHLAHGLHPLWFHISTFFWFLVQLALMYLLYRYILDAVEPRAANRYVSLFAVLWYALHPVTAETVNYVIQRADLYATLGVVAGLVIYIRFPAARKFGFYLLPVILGAMSKATAVVFGGILFLYIFLFEEDADWNRVGQTIVRALPALLVSGILAILNIKLTSKSYLPATTPSTMYWATQPYVLMKYVRSLLLPLWLSADTDMTPFSGFTDILAICGIVFCAAFLLFAFAMIKRREHRPIAFGIFWFFFASAPTSVFVLAEVENDHRMFFPFVGLVLSVTWAAALVIFEWLKRAPETRAATIRAVQLIGALILIAYGIGTWQRNEVWRSEESLFYDVTIKSPTNGRGLMNYGLTQMEKGEAQRALDYFTRAAAFTPAYPTLEINTGIADGVLNRQQDAEAHFRRAISLAPNDAQPYFYYGRWLKTQGRLTECVQEEKLAIAKNPPWLEPRYLLMETYVEQGQWNPLKELAQDTLRLAPNDQTAQQYLKRSENAQDEVKNAEKLVADHPTAENYLDLSLLYDRTGRYQDCIAAAKKAIQLRPNYPEAYNNIAAAYEDLHQWDEAIAAAQQALKLKPDYQLAKNNLTYSLSQKNLKSR